MFQFACRQNNHMVRPWIPNELEKKCLSHMDAPDSWKILRREKPEDERVLPWSYFVQILRINFTLFIAIMVALFLGWSS
ncbi:hypothetical protein BH11ARM1_BH11ARM1_14890 [soil metagenome]